MDKEYIDVEVYFSDDELEEIETEAKRTGRTPEEQCKYWIFKGMAFEKFIREQFK